MTRHALDCGLICGLAECDCGAEQSQYRVLKDYPRTEKTGETTQTPEGLIRWQRVASWAHVGYANNMADAKAKFGGCPVLEQIRFNQP
jgi:hypothetical protein